MAIGDGGEGVDAGFCGFDRQIESGYNCVNTLYS
jgi:hypothetical protein